MSVGKIRNVIKSGGVTTVRESGGTNLAMGAVSAGMKLKRVGGNLVGHTASFGQCHVASGSHGITGLGQANVWHRMSGTSTLNYAQGFSHASPLQLTYTGSTVTEHFLIAADLTLNYSQSSHTKTLIDLAFAHTGAIVSASMQQTVLSGNVASSQAEFGIPYSCVSLRTVLPLVRNDTVQVWSKANQVCDLTGTFCSLTITPLQP